MTTTELTRASEDDQLTTRDGMRSLTETIARVHHIKSVQARLMKANVHYGVIPGTNKPTLYAPGADLLLVSFRIAPKKQSMDDLSLDDVVRYRVTVVGVNQMTGEELGEGVGEASSDEDRYKWRRAVCEDEWNETPSDRRREKWAKGAGGKAYKTKQVRTNLADVANTVLKIAFKRAKVAMTLNVTGCSDVFAQDIEDLSEELRDEIRESGPAPLPQPAKRTEPPPPPVVDIRQTGQILQVHDRGNAIVVELTTEFMASTRDAGLIDRVRQIAALDPPPMITLKTRPSSDPSKFAPIIEDLVLTDAPDPDV